MPFSEGDLDQPHGFVADGGQVQFVGGGADGGLRGGVGHAHALLPGQRLIVAGQRGGGPVVAG